MKTTLNLTSFIQRFNPLSEKSPLWNLTSGAAPRTVLLTLLALSLVTLGGWERLTALAADVVPGGYVQIQPNAVTLTQGATQQLRAAVLNPLGFELPNRRVTWSSNNLAIASVSDTGLVTAVAPGTATITAKSGAALGTASITVNGIVIPPPNTAPTVTITAPADGSTFQQSALITFTATATDLEDGNLSAAIVWTATNANNPSAITALGTGASVNSSSLAPGSYLVTARVTDSGNLASVAQVGITVNSPCSISTSLTPASGVRLAQTLTLDASGSSDTCNRPLKYYWTCTSFTSLECTNFLALANANDNTNSVVFLNLQESDVFDIVLTICASGTNQCAPQVVRRYEGASGSFQEPTDYMSNGSNFRDGKQGEERLKPEISRGTNFQFK